MVAMATTQSKPQTPALESDDGPLPVPLMLSVADVAATLSCSSKTVYRLNDRGALPRPVRIGGLLRWQRQLIEEWIDKGCPQSRRK